MAAQIYQTFRFSERSWKSRFFKRTNSQLLNLAINSAFLETWVRPHRYDQKVYGFMMVRIVKLSGCEKRNSWEGRGFAGSSNSQSQGSRMLNLPLSLAQQTFNVWDLVMDEIPALATPGQSTMEFHPVFLLSFSPALISEMGEKKKQLTSVLLSLIFSTLGDLLRLNTSTEIWRHYWLE